MDKNKIAEMKMILKSSNSEYKNVICNFDINSSDFFKNIKDSNSKVEQLIFRIALKKIRNLKNITQKSLAELTGKKTITIQGYENARLKISTEFMYLVIKKINLTKKEFIDNILFSDELIAILYTFIKTLIYESKKENETEILNFIEKTFSNIIMQLFENEDKNITYKIQRIETEKKITFNELERSVLTFSLLLNNDLLKNIQNINDDDKIKILEDLKKYYLFLISYYSKK